MALGRTWNAATLAWAGDTQTWDLGTGAVSDAGNLSVGESAGVVVLHTSADAGVLALTEQLGLLAFFPAVDTAAVALVDSAQITVLVAPSDDGFTVGVTERLETLVDDWPQVQALPSVSWGQEEAVSGTWTKVPPATPSGWN